MDRKKLVIIPTMLLILTVMQPVFTAENIKISQKNEGGKTHFKLEIIDWETKKILKSETVECENDGDIIVYHWPNSNSNYPWNLFEVPTFGIGLENYEKIWDDSGGRNCWEYKQRLMWWASSLNIYGEYTEDPYYDLDVYFWPEVEYECWEGESFMFGGWNVSEAEDPGDYSDWNSLLATLLLFPFFALPVKQFPLIRAEAVLSLLCGIEEEIQPTYAWDGSNIYDASGCFEHDSHVYPNTEFSKVFWFRFAYTPGDPFVKTLGIRFSGTSPPPPPNLALSPSSHNFKDVKIGKESEAESFTIENNGLTTQEVEVILTNGVLNNWKLVQGGGTYDLEPGESEIIKVKFTPQNKGIEDIDLMVLYEGGSLTSELYGNGVSKFSIKSLTINMFLERITQFLQTKL